MTDQQAQELMRKIEAAWTLRLTTEQRDFWRKALIPENYEAADKAITTLTKTQIHRPAFAEIRELIKAYEFTHRQAEPEKKCPTCEGDRFVVVSTRRVYDSQWMQDRGLAPTNDMVEEYAACPDCNPADTGFHRQGGEMAKAHDPAKVRQMMLR